MNTTPTTELKAHPFELAGMGTGPYRFVGMVSMPSLSLAEANPDAYNNAMRDLPTHLVGGCGTCSNCGMAIRNICIVRDAQGREYGVGCDCVEKTEDKALGDAASVAIAKHQRQLRFERVKRQREEKRRVWLDTISTDSRALPGMTNREFIAKQDEQIRAQSEARKRAEQARAEKFADILPTLDASCEFHRSLAAQLRGGSLSERQAHFVAKAFFHRRSKANGEAFDSIVARCCE